MNKYFLLIVIVTFVSNFAYADKVIRCSAYKKGSNLNPINAIVIRDSLKDSYEVHLNGEVYTFKWKNKDGSYRGNFSSNTFFINKSQGFITNPNYNLKNCK